MNLLKRYWKRLSLSFIVLLLLVCIGFFAWATLIPAPSAEAFTALEGDASVQVVEDSGNWIFTPSDNPSQTGFVFYPGGRVDPRAYAPLAYDVAEAGYLAVIVSVPLNLAIFEIEAALPIINTYPDIQHWAVGGHSLGGSMAARFINAHSDEVTGLALLASYPDIDLSPLDIEVVSIYGSLDGLATPTVVEASGAKLPEDTVWVRLEGGNHAQFGWYGPQDRDNLATMPPQEQQAQTSQAVIDLLARISDLSE